MRSRQTLRTNSLSLESSEGGDDVELAQFRKDMVIDKILPRRARIVRDRFGNDANSGTEP